MADLINFTFHKNVVHTQVINESPYFLAKDVCSILEFSNYRKSLKDHVNADDVTKSYITDSLGRQQLALWINESGLYSLILGSKLPNAQTFKHWITSKVLPSLNSSGRYELAQIEPKTSDSADVLNTEQLNALRSFLKSYESFKNEMQEFKKGVSCLRWLLDEHQKYPDDLEYQVAVLPTLTEKLFNYEDLFNEEQQQFVQGFKVVSELINGRS